MKLINLEMDYTVLKSGVFLAKFGHKLLLSYLLSLIMCKSVGKMLGRSALCIKVSSDSITFLKTMLIFQIFAHKNSL